MTVDELLKILAHTYPAFTVERMTHWAPVYRARLQHREGPHLGLAVTEALGTFEAKNAKPFPIPKDFEVHLPSLSKIDSDKKDPPIRAKLTQRHERSRQLLADWEAGQGSKIKASRAPQLHAACWLEAFDQAKAKALDERVTALKLDQPTINKCFQRAISTERAKRMGRMLANPQRHWSQLEEIAHGWGLEITPSWWSEEMGRALTQERL